MSSVLIIYVLGLIYEDNYPPSNPKVRIDCI